jgi:hypothetical protein
MGRAFEALIPEMDVIEILNRETTQDWLNRIANAVANLPQS